MTTILKNLNSLREQQGNNFFKKTRTLKVIWRGATKT